MRVRVSKRCSGWGVWLVAADGSNAAFIGNHREWKPAQAQADRWGRYVRS